jgi:hypothetical protein
MSFYFLTGDEPCHLHAPDYAAARRVAHCRTCRQRRRCVQLLYEWYEPLWYCTSCGESPGDWPQRFKRVTPARMRKIDKAKRLYAAATTLAEALRRTRDCRYG